jgi:hypothetical protein
MLVALAALAVSVCAVAVSVYEASLQRQHARAEAWPHVELTITVSSERAQIAVRNSGLGPAAIEHVAVQVDGRPASGWTTVLPELLGRQPDAYHVSSLTGRVLRAGDEFALVEVPGRLLPADIMTRLPRLSMRICYRSVFDERWELVVPRLIDAGDWHEVDRCPAARQQGITF